MMKEQIPSRRVVLRGVVALGCGIWVPVVLSGCDSKKDAGVGAGSAQPPQGTAAKPDAATPEPPKKVAQANVLYQNQPKGEEKCAGCINFIAESNTCKLVEGQISPEGWCNLWTRKA